MKTLTLYIMAALLCAASAEARIGETAEQIEARYGKSVNAGAQFKGNSVVLFFKGEMQVGVVFHDGKSVVEIYSHRDNSILTENEVNLLLAANAQGDSWKPDERAAFFSVRGWKLESKHCVAMMMGDGRLCVSIEDFVATQAPAEQKELKDF